MGNGGPFLYPNVSTVRPRPEANPSGRGLEKAKNGPGEFDKLLDTAMGTVPGGVPGPVTQPLKFSSHATQRLHDRKINLDPETLGRVRDAVDQAASKGIEDTLVLTDDAALIVSVKNRTVITAMDRGSMNGNVFTNIDGAVFV